MSSDLTNGGSIDPGTTTAATTIKPRGMKHNQKNKNKAEAKLQPQASHGDPLLREWTIVGEYPLPTDGSAPIPRMLPRVAATPATTYAEVTARGERVDPEDLLEWDMVTTLDEARFLRGAENGDVLLPSCENGKPAVKGKGWFWWLFGK